LRTTALEGLCFTELLFIKARRIYFANGRAKFIFICDRNNPFQMHSRKDSMDQNYQQRVLDPTGPFRLLNLVWLSLHWSSKTSVSFCLVMTSVFMYPTVSRCSFQKLQPIICRVKIIWAESYTSELFILVLPFGFRIKQFPFKT